jgi:cytochrome c553
MIRLSMMSVSCIALLLGESQLGAAADEQAGRKLSDATCVACHGQNGIGIIELYPNLAGQKREYLVAQMRAFRDGSRKNPIMAPMAVHLSDGEIEDLAAYFAALK